MSATHEMEYKGKKVKITVAKTSQGKQVGTIIVADTDPPLRGTGADASSAEEALHNAERVAKELIDQRS
jgi:predicted GNAT family acetyltransferase